MTRFLLSHNRQIQTELFPVLSAQQLAAGLQSCLGPQVQLQSLSHPHWLVGVDSQLPPQLLATTLLEAWRSMRAGQGSPADTALLALGGRKDEPARPGSPLGQGDWGVDVVETLDAAAFLTAIDWERLRQGRPADGIFEIHG